MQGFTTDDALNLSVGRVLSIASEDSWHQLSIAIARQIQQSVNLSDILQTTAEVVRRLLECDRVLIYEFHPEESGQITVEAVADPCWSLLNQPVQDSCFEGCWLNGESKHAVRAIANVEDETKNYSPCYSDFLRKFQIKALSIATLQYEQSPWGLLIAHHCTAPRPWTTAETQALQTITLHLSIAIQQAALRIQAQAAPPQADPAIGRQNQRQQAQLAAIVESSQDAIISKTLDGRITSWNQAAEHLFGYTAAEAIGKPITLIIPTDRQSEAAAICQRLHRGETIAPYETQRRHKSGHLVDVAITISPMHDATGKIIGASKIARDITEKKQQQQALHDQAAILQSFYDTSPFMMGIVELSEDDILHVSDNQATAIFFQTSVNALKGQWASALGTPSEHIRTWLTHYRQSQAQQHPVRFDYAHTTPDHTYWLSIVVSFIGIAESQRPQFSYVVEDVSAQKAILRERQQAEAALKESEARWQFALEGSGDGVWDWNTQTNEVFFSHQWKAMLGYDKDEIGTELEEWSSRVHPDDLEQCYADLQRHFQGKTPTYQNEHRVRCKNGDYKWVLDRGQVIEWQAPNQPLRVIGTHTDITQRKQAEIDLHAKTAELDQFFSIALDLLCIANTDGYFLRLNQQWERTLGYPLAELEGARFLDFVHPDDFESTLEQLNRLSHQQTVKQFTNRYRCQDGSYCWLEWRSIPVGNRVYAAARDITLRRQAESALQQANEQLELVLQASSEGFSDWNLITNEIYFSPRWKAILGYADHELENSLEMWNAMIFDVDREASWQLVEDYNSGKVDEFVITQRHRHKDGSTVHMLTRVIHVKDAQGQAVRMVGSHLDVTALANMQEALQTSEAQLSSLLNSALDGIMAFRSLRNDEGDIVDFEWLLSNPAACAMVGRTEDYLVGRRLLEEMPGNREEGLFAAYINVVESDSPDRREFHYHHDGLESWFENVAVKLADGFAVTFRNITPLKQSEQALQAANNQLESHIQHLQQRNQEMQVLGEISDFLQACLTVEEAAAAISSLVEPLFPDCAGGIFTLNASRNRIENVAHWGSALPSNLDFQPQDCWALRRGRYHLAMTHQPGLRCRHTHTLETSTTTLCIPMVAQGETLGLLLISTTNAEALSINKQQLARALAEQVGMAISNLNLREKLLHQSIRDPLTGLFNRRYLEESLNQELARAQRQKSVIGIIMLDVDHFKHFNDTFGHDAGDYVLQMVGALLKDCVRSSDIACRFGGEEMTLVLPDSTLEDTASRAEEIRVAIAQLALIYQHQSLGLLTISLGVACFPTHGTTSNALIQSADAALYRAKTNGRNRVEIA